MSWHLNAADRQLLAAVGRLGFANPFQAERIELERAILGQRFVAGEAVWSVQRVPEEPSQNLQRISAQAGAAVDRIRAKLAAEEALAADDAEIYSDAALYVLFDQYRVEFQTLIDQGHAGKSPPLTKLWRRFQKSVAHYFHPGGVRLPTAYDDAHMFAIFFQLRRAFFHVFYFIVGRSPAAASLRAAIWQSLFTHDLRRYQRSLWRHMDDAATLITGPSGTGKELVARAIGFSRYIPFDQKRVEFVQPFYLMFQPVNLSALSPTLIESELFGHRRGSFTGAIDDRIGWLENCQPHASVFLDEVGELDAAIQVKLLRVLQTRCFQRLGDTTDLHFAGKVVSATSRDPFAEIDAGRLREDFYYRLCSDRIETPSLRQQLDLYPEDLRHLLAFIAARIAPDDAPALADEAHDWIAQHLGPHYQWPGNFRELEQCFRNVMIHGEYRASPVATETAAVQYDSPAAQAAAACRVTAEELVRLYCCEVYEQCGSYEQTARRLGLDRRTVKRKVIAQRDDAVS